MPAEEGELQPEQRPFPAPHQGGAAVDGGGGAVVGPVGQQVGGQGVPQPQDDNGGNQPGEKQQKGKHPDSGPGPGEQQHKHRNRQRKAHQEIPPQHPDIDAQIHQNHPSGHRKALHQGVGVRVQLPVGPQGPQAQSEADNGGIQVQQQLKKQVGCGEGPVLRAGQGNQAEQQRHPGGHGDIGQGHHPEFRVGEGHSLPGLALELDVVKFHEVVLQSWFSKGRRLRRPGVSKKHSVKARAQKPSPFQREGQLVEKRSTVL